MIHNIFCESNKAQETYVVCSWELKPELAEKKRSAYLAKIFYATYLCLCFASLLLSFVTSFFRTYRYQFGSTQWKISSRLFQGI